MLNNEIEFGFFDSDFPTEIKDEYWVYTTLRVAQKYKRRFNDSNIGKWLIFSDIKDHDRNWQLIRRATQDGLLGISAKAATGKINSNAISDEVKVICVYTYNHLDINDVYRVEKGLRNIGIDQELYYKSDSDTTDGIYIVNGDRKISKYVSRSIRKSNVDNLSSIINGIGKAKQEILKGIGIKTIDDLLSFDTSKELSNVGISSKQIDNFKLIALSHVEESIFCKSLFKFPNQEIVYFDIETSLDPNNLDKKVWCIAVFYNKEVKRFFAEKWEHEREILIEFLAFIKELNNPCLFSYSGTSFDKDVLVFSFKRYNLESEYFLGLNHYDLCSIIKKNYIFPVKSYGLKEIGKYLGYKFKNKNMDGLDVAWRYNYCQATGTRLPKSIFNYIDDDVKSIDYILNQLKNRDDIKLIF